MACMIEATCSKRRRMKHAMDQPVLEQRPLAVASVWPPGCNRKDSNRAVADPPQARCQAAQGHASPAPIVPGVMDAAQCGDVESVPVGFEDPAPASLGRCHAGTTLPEPVSRLPFSIRST